jgi:hypothetical protein
VLAAERLIAPYRRPVLHGVRPGGRPQLPGNWPTATAKCQSLCWSRPGWQATTTYVGNELADEDVCRCGDDGNYVDHGQWP